MVTVTAEMPPVFESTVAVAVAPVPGSTTVGVTMAENEYVRSCEKIGNLGSAPKVIVPAAAGATGAG